jgi:hypothetical protein
VRLTRRDALKAIATATCLGGAPVRAAAPAYEEAVRQTWRHTAGSQAGPRAPQLELIRYATLAPNGHNTQPWKFRVQGDTVDIVPDRARRTPVVDPDDHHLWVSLGCATENLVRAAPAFGRHADVSVAATGVHLALAPPAVQRSSRFEAIPQRQSTRAEYDGRALSIRELRQLEVAAADDSVQVLLLTDRARIKRVQDYVVAGNTSQVADAAFITELKSWIRFSERDAVARRDGLFAGSSGNPALPRWLGSLMFDLFFTASAENEKYVSQLQSSAGVVVFAAARDDPAGWVAAGRACERFLLQATVLDVRTAFINQPVEVAAIRTQFAAELGVGQRRPDLVVRFGHGSRLPSSLRRPVDALLIP